MYGLSSQDDEVVPAAKADPDMAQLRVRVIYISSYLPSNLGTGVYRIAQHADDC